MTTLSTPSANRFRFRAWDTEEKQMIYPSWDGNKIVSLCVYPDGFPNEKWEMLQCEKDKHYEIWITKSSRGFLMQSTGLTDKNGKEIFEGDILRGTFEMCGDRKNKDKYLGWVEWLDGECIGWALCEPTGHKEIISANSDLRDLVHSITVDFINGEVIGNIYENPDLLPSA